MILYIKIQHSFLQFRERLKKQCKILATLTLRIYNFNDFDSSNIFLYHLGLGKAHTRFSITNIDIQKLLFHCNFNMFRLQLSDKLLTNKAAEQFLFFYIMIINF